MTFVMCFLSRLFDYSYGRMQERKGRNIGWFEEHAQKWTEQNGRLKSIGLRGVEDGLVENCFFLYCELCSVRAFDHCGVALFYLG